MVEYSIFIQNGSCPEYNALGFYYNNFQEVLLKLNDMVQLEEKRRRPYYVENDFFKNKHNFNYNGKIFIIKSRVVTDWTIYKEEKTTKDNNILIFKKSY